MAPLKRRGRGNDFLLTHARSIVAASIAGLLSVGPPVRAQLTREEVNTIRESAPASSTVKPKQPRLLLVFSRAEGYKHSAIPYCATALEILGKKTGAYETVQSEDLAMFLPENIKRFDAVCLNNTTQLKFDDPVLRRSLLDFVAGGKGIIGIHAATDNFPSWSEGQELFGGVFDGHPWTADGTWQVRIEDPAHPLDAAFSGNDFLIKDEIYRIRQIDLRKNCRVLLGLDMKAERNRAAPGVRSTDRDIPISWVRRYGRGRLFYCSLGHNDSVYMNPAVLRHYLDGIQFAMGDLECETAPVAFDPMTFFDGNTLAALLRRVSAYQYGGSRAALTELNAFVRGVDDIPEARRSMEREFLDFLKGSGTAAGKQFICTKLSLIGSDASAGELSAMLSDSSTAEMALLALEPIGGSAVDDALAQALTSVRGRTQIGVITALGNRRVLRVTPALEALASHGDPGAALAAVAALGRIGTPEALDGLTRAMEGSKGDVRAAIPDAMLSCAGRLHAAGDTSRAVAVYAVLIGSGYPAPVRSAALRGLVVSDPLRGAKLIRETLRNGDVSLHGTAARLLREIPEIDDVRSIAGDIPGMPPATRVRVLSSLERYPDPAVRNAVAGATAGKNREVRIAALRTLGVMGDAGAVFLLARAAARSAGNEQKEARASLYGLHAPGVNDSILARLPGADSRTKVELLKAIAERVVPPPQPVRAAREPSGEVHLEAPKFPGMPQVLAAGKDPDAGVRVESAKTLRVLAGADEVPVMIDLLLAGRDESFRREMEIALSAASRRGPAPQDRTLLEAYSRVTGERAQISLIILLGKIGGAASLPVLRRTLNDPRAGIRLAGIRALSLWPTAGPYGDLRALAQGAISAPERILALRGTVRLIGIDSTRSPDETVRMYRDAMGMAPGVAERRLLLSALGETRSVAALRMAADYLNDNDLHGEAESAVLNIAGAVPDSARREAVPVIEKLIASARDRENVSKGKDILASIERYDDYITVWEYAGPYEEAGGGLLDLPFPPELAQDPPVSWLPLRTMTDRDNPWLLEFDKLFPREDILVYVRTRVWSPAEGSARLETRSNYGIKVWLNGSLVHTSNTVRNIASNPDVVPARLVKGWNTLMMKLEQGEPPWGACVRLRAADGGRLEGTRASTIQN